MRQVMESIERRGVVFWLLIGALMCWPIWIG